MPEETDQLELRNRTVIVEDLIYAPPRNTEPLSGQEVHAELLLLALDVRLLAPLLAAQHVRLLHLLFYELCHGDALTDRSAHLSTLVSHLLLFLFFRSII